jgi:hypothetical protein
MARTKATTARPIKSLSTRAVALWTALAIFLLIIANSAIWFNRYIFDTKQFTTIATTSLTSESSQQALADEVTDRLLQNRPVLKKVLDDRVNRLIQALLGTDLNTKLIQKSVTTLHTAITSKNPQDVAIDLSGVKSIVVKVVTAAREVTDRPEDQYKIDLNDIPDKIVLVDTSKLPNIYTIGVVVMWVGLLSFFASLGLLIYLFVKAFKSRDRLKQTLAIVGSGFVVGTIVAMLLGPLFKPSVLAQVKSSNIRVVADNLYSAFFSRFNSQTAWLMLIPALILLAIWLWLELWPRLRPVKR